MKKHKDKFEQVEAYIKSFHELDNTPLGHELVEQNSLNYTGMANLPQICNELEWRLPQVKRINTWRKRFGLSCLLLGLLIPLTLIFAASRSSILIPYESVMFTGCLIVWAFGSNITSRFFTTAKNFQTRCSLLSELVGYFPEDNVPQDVEQRLEAWALEIVRLRMANQPDDFTTTIGGDNGRYLPLGVLEKKFEFRVWLAVSAGASGLGIDDLYARARQQIES